MREHQVAHFARILDAEPTELRDFKRYAAAQGLGTLWHRWGRSTPGAERWRPTVVAALERAAVDPWSWVRKAAARGLGQVEGTVTAPLAALTTDPDPDVRRQAILAAGRIDPEPVLAVLIAALDEPPFRNVAAEALGGLRQVSDSTIAALCGALAHSYSGGTAARSLARLGQLDGASRRRVHEALLGRLDDPHPTTRKQALIALSKMGADGWRDRCVEAVRDPDPDVRSAAILALIRHGGATDAVLRAGASDSDWLVKARLADFIAGARRPVKGAAGALEIMLGDPDSRVTTSAVRALGYLPGATTTRQLRAALDHAMPPVRADAATALGRRGDATDIDPLLGHLGDDDWRVRAAAAIAVARLGRPKGEAQHDVRSPLLDRLVALLDDPAAEVRRQATRALGVLGDRRAVPAVRAAGEAGKVEVWAVGSALKELSEPR